MDEGFAPSVVSLREVEGVDFTIGMGLAWNKEDPTANLEEFVEIARSLASVSRPRKPAGGHSEKPGKTAAGRRIESRQSN